MKKAALGAIVIFLLTLTGCASMLGGGNKAVARMTPTSGHDTRGMVQFEQRESRVMVLVDVAGLPPSHVHGFLLYPEGNCQALKEDAAARPFVLPNLKTDSRGVAKVSFEVDGMTVKPGTDSMMGWSLLVHSSPAVDTFAVLRNPQSWLGCGVVRVP